MGYRTGTGTGTGNCSFFWWYRNRYRKKLAPEKSLRTGIGKNWYRKKVSEPVSVKFCTRKSTGTGIEKFGTGKKYRYRYRLKFWAPSYSAPRPPKRHPRNPNRPSESDF